MRKYRTCLLIFLAIYAITISICIALSLSVPVCPAVGELPADAFDGACVLADWKSNPLGKGEYAITLTGADPSQPMALTLYDIGSFELWQDGRQLHSYDINKGYVSSHVLALQASDTLNLILKTTQDSISDSFFPAASTKTRILISSWHRAAQMNQLVLCVNAGTIGVYLLVILYSLSLYVQKRSEVSLLLLCCLAMIALVSSLTNSNLVVNAFANINSIVRIHPTINSKDFITINNSAKRL